LQKAAGLFSGLQKRTPRRQRVAPIRATLKPPCSSCWRSNACRADLAEAAVIHARDHGEPWYSPAIPAMIKSAMMTPTTSIQFRLYSNHDMAFLP
jgi:hypothetical protein